MSSLTLVRHAQASFFADHYDQLSELGQSQARILGEAWTDGGRVVHEVYVGPRKRQQQTAAIVADCYRQRGLSFPEPIMLAELDEYDLGGIQRRLAPQFAQQNAEFARLAESFRNGTSNAERERSFQRMFEPLMHHWLSVDTVIEGLEGWQSFRKRVERGLALMIERPGQGRHIVAFTSGGYIGTAMHVVLSSPPRTALEMNWRVRNGSLTEFVFSRGRVTLDAFNSVAHFTKPELLTYR